MRLFVLPLLLFLTLSTRARAQSSDRRSQNPEVDNTPDTTALGQFLDDYNIRFGAALQLYSTYSLGMQAYDRELGQYVDVDDRVAFELHRSRFGISGQPYRTLKFVATAAIDFVGRDVLSATDVAVNNGPSPDIRLWNAWLDWQLSRNADGLRLLGGYFTTPIGRESNTPMTQSNTFEKAWSQNYLRRHLVGYGPGRATGAMVGGQVGNSAGNFHVRYQLAAQTPLFQDNGGNSRGRASAPLLVANVLFQFGEPESAGYSLTYKPNYFGNRRGVSIGLAVAHQGNTDLFDNNGAYGLDWLISYDDFHLDGDVYRLKREQNGTRSDEGVSGYTRVGYNLDVGRGMALEPVASFWWFYGATDAEGIARAQAVGAFAGNNTAFDIGVNLHFNPKLKVMLFYNTRRGDAGAGDPVTIKNNYFQQPAFGAVRRGNYVGFGATAVL